METTSTYTRRTMRTLGAAVLMVGSTQCTLKQPPVTDAGSATANPKTSSASDATLTQSGAPTGNYTRIEELIAARAPGIQVIRGDGGYSLRIRGMSSPSGVTDPLIVIDGTISALPGTRGLDGISPQDVLRVEVLKDAASTAFYGMRGASGVILITTRKK
jgi:TonB-dependent SusC/RagA subfamily outer membrane receptor